MLAIQPLRHGVFKKFFNRFKYNKQKRELLLKTIEESEEYVADILAPSGEYVHFLDAIPEMKTFLAEIEAKEKLELETAAAQIAQQETTKYSEKEEKPIKEKKGKKLTKKQRASAEEDEALD